MIEVLWAGIISLAVISACWLIAAGCVWVQGKWQAYRASQPPKVSRQDLLEHLEEIDAEILDLFDERADTVQALRKIGYEGRA